MKPEIKNKIESFVFNTYIKNRLLVTAEHAYVSKKPLKKYGKNAVALLGDVNTGWLARQAAYSTLSAYVIPKFHRTSADAARNPLLLLKGVRYSANVEGGSVKKIKVRIHSDPGFSRYMLAYHALIEELSPNSILSIHGMHYRKMKVDMILGFGKDKNYILGNRNAFRFRREMRRNVKNAIKNTNIDGYPQLGRKLNIIIGKKKFTGYENFPLRKYVTEHNKMHEKKRIGLHVEISAEGRRSSPAAEYQIAVQVLAKMMIEWSKRLENG